MKISIQFPHDRFTATLEDQSASRSLLAMLPLNLKVSDFASAEKIAYLPQKLDVADAPKGTAAVPGDLAYYAPWGNLALFYKKTAHAAGLVRLGRIDGDIGKLSRLGDGIVTIERVDD